MVRAVAAAAARDRLKQARRDTTRRHLLAAAEEVFAARGYEETRIKDVAVEAGLALATIYELYPSKEDLYADIHRTRGRVLLEHAAQAAVGASSAFDAILRGVRAYVEFLCQHPSYLRVQLREKQPWALMPRFNSAEQRRLWERGLELTVAAFRAAIAEGSVVDDDPETMARLMVAAHQVYLGRWVERGMREPVAALVERMQAHVARAFGVARRGARSSRAAGARILGA
jgi:AcrR family transcriptional regulator